MKSLHSEGGRPNLFHRNRWLAVAVLGVVLPALTGCGSFETHSLSMIDNSNITNHTTDVANVVNTSAKSSNPKSKSVHNVILAKSSLPGRNGQQLELVDVSGKYVYNPTVGPFQGDTWTGQFQLRVVNSTGEAQSELSLTDSRFTQLLFREKFQFHFADYTGDGNPDFTLGQHAGSNGSWYQLFEVKPSAIIELQTEPAQLFVSDYTYSPLFQQVKHNGFKIKYYDNAKAKSYQATYLWENGKFEQSSLHAVSSN